MLVYNKSILSSNNQTITNYYDLYNIWSHIENVISSHLLSFSLTAMQLSACMNATNLCRRPQMWRHTCFQFLSPKTRSVLSPNHIPYWFSFFDSISALIIDRLNILDTSLIPTLTPRPLAFIEIIVSKLLTKFFYFASPSTKNAFFIDTCIVTTTYLRFNFHQLQISVS